ncbi:heme-binding protein [Kitasatospora sp. NRRL B-11411]|uniref:GlcG/HbpS family heme-binding protein n=1 Tax=Kitasatospora sp. NRRL B-11411 TaxID=1463822 RepID=UPI000A40A2BB|nr:heme-binding protein [Kitasatospora sp. NRRL B-11411]
MWLRARVVSCGAVLAVGLGVAAPAGAFADTGGAVPQGADAPGAAAPAAVASVADCNVVQTSHLTEQAALTAARAALAAAEAAGQHVSVAVVDRSGNPIVQLRGDGSGPHTYESAERKAYTAASFNAATSALVQRLQTDPTLADIPGTLFLAGGLPIRYQGSPIAGIGVAGAPSGATDEQFAQAGIDALAG